MSGVGWGSREGRAGPGGSFGVCPHPWVLGSGSGAAPLPIGTGLCWYLTREVVVGSTIVRRQVPAFQAPSEVAWSYNLH